VAQTKDDFYVVLSAAIDDIIMHGFDSAERIERWTRELRTAAERSMIKPESLEQMLRDGLAAEYRKMVEQGRLPRYHKGIDRYTLERIKPSLRSELDRRILASASLIKLNRTEAINKTLQRFQGWSTSIPAGGVSEDTKAEVRANVRKSLKQLPFEERRVLIDQGHKLISSINDVVASGGGAIAGMWRSNFRQPGYDYREDHKERDSKIFLIRDSWAHVAGLVKPAKSVGYVDDITAPAQEPFCRCLTGDTEISYAVGISVLSRRYYDGPILKIISAAMPKSALMITPNHPVLTPRGWVAAESLNVGDDLIEFVQKDVTSAVGINDKNNRPPTIAEIFGAAAKTCGMRSVGDASVQFHGDGMPDGKVDIVRPNGFLSFNIESPHCLQQFDLTKPHGHAFGLGAIYQMFSGLWSTCKGLLDRLSQMSRHSSSLGLPNPPPTEFAGFALFEHRNFSLFRAALADLERRGSGMRSDFKAGLAQSAADSGVADFELICERHRIPTAQIRISKVLDIKRDAFSGHVFNLQTEGEWYSANRIISHNCYYTYLYNLRDLPEAMLTAKGKESLQQVRGREEVRAARTGRADDATPRPTPKVGNEALRLQLDRLKEAL